MNGPLVLIKMQFAIQQQALFLFLPMSHGVKSLFAMFVLLLKVRRVIYCLVTLLNQMIIHQLAIHLHVMQLNLVVLILALAKQKCVKYYQYQFTYHVQLRLIAGFR